MQFSTIFFFCKSTKWFYPIQTLIEFYFAFYDSLNISSCVMCQYSDHSGYQPIVDSANDKMFFYYIVKCFEMGQFTMFH